MTTRTNIHLLSESEINLIIEKLRQRYSITQVSKEFNVEEADLQEWICDVIQLLCLHGETDQQIHDDLQIPIKAIEPITTRYIIFNRNLFEFLYNIRKHMVNNSLPNDTNDEFKQLDLKYHILLHKYEDSPEYDYLESMCEQLGNPFKSDQKVE